MTQEEKQLLLKDLCARLPYGVIIAYKEGKNDYHCWTLRTLNAPGISKSDTAPDSDGEIEYTEQAGIGTRTSIRPLRLEKMLPYLRPMSSMTEEEEDILYGKVLLEPAYRDDDDACFNDDEIVSYVDYCYSRHLDMHGLIHKGLALEAPENMYKIK